MAFVYPVKSSGDKGKTVGDHAEDLDPSEKGGNENISIGKGSDERRAREEQQTNKKRNQVVNMSCERIRANEAPCINPVIEIQCIFGDLDVLTSDFLRQLLVGSNIPIPPLHCPLKRKFRAELLGPPPPPPRKNGVKFFSK